ncbi:hypothetical protein VPH35_126137 [Triticum aestivum]
MVKVEEAQAEANIGSSVSSMLGHNDDQARQSSSIVDLTSIDDIDGQAADIGHVPMSDEDSRYDDGYMSDWEGRPRCGSKVRSSDEDSGWWVGERDVDRKAANYINEFHQKKAPPTPS